MGEYVSVQDVQIAGRTPDHEAELALDPDSDGDTTVLVLTIQNADGDALAECSVAGSGILDFFAAVARVRAGMGL